MTNWLFWAIPNEYVWRYIVLLWFVLFLMPGWIFGVQYTKLGLVLNWIWYDIIFYGWFKVKEQIERMDK
jgi:hypothetical protein|tara:strand:- start:2659 stop:2865 length:207 start_codon:yes stop_codon:yes gene_type:complete